MRDGAVHRRLAAADARSEKLRTERKRPPAGRVDGDAQRRTRRRARHGARHRAARRRRALQLELAVRRVAIALGGNDRVGLHAAVEPRLGRPADRRRAYLQTAGAGAEQATGGEGDGSERPGRARGFGRHFLPAAFALLPRLQTAVAIADEQAAAVAVERQRARRADDGRRRRADQRALRAQRKEVLQQADGERADDEQRDDAQPGERQRVAVKDAAQRLGSAHAERVGRGAHETQEDAILDGRRMLARRLAGEERAQPAPDIGEARPAARRRGDTQRARGGGRFVQLLEEVGQRLANRLQVSRRVDCRVGCRGPARRRWRPLSGRQTGEQRATQPVREIGVAQPGKLRQLRQGVGALAFVGDQAVAEAQRQRPVNLGIDGAGGQPDEDARRQVGGERVDDAGGEVRTRIFAAEQSVEVAQVGRTRALGAANGGRGDDALLTDDFAEQSQTGRVERQQAQAGAFEQPFAAPPGATRTRREQQRLPLRPGQQAGDARRRAAAVGIDQLARVGKDEQAARGETRRQLLEILPAEVAGAALERLMATAQRVACVVETLDRQAARLQAGEQLVDGQRQVVAQAGAVDEDEEFGFSQRSEDRCEQSAGGERRGDAALAVEFVRRQPVASAQGAQKAQPLAAKSAAQAAVVGVETLFGGAAGRRQTFEPAAPAQPVPGPHGGEEEQRGGGEDEVVDDPMRFFAGLRRQGFRRRRRKGGGEGETGRRRRAWGDVGRRFAWQRREDDRHLLGKRRGEARRG